PQRILGRSYEKPILRCGWAFYLVQVALLAAVYFGAAKLGLTMAFVAEQVTAVWPPTGIALAALLLFGYRLWPGIALGAFLANATAHEPLATAAGIALGNTLEALVGAWLLRRLVKFDPALRRVKDVLSLVVLAAGVSKILLPFNGSLFGSGDNAGNKRRTPSGSRATRMLDARVLWVLFHWEMIAMDFWMKKLGDEYQNELISPSEKDRKQVFDILEKRLQ